VAEAREREAVNRFGREALAVDATTRKIRVRRFAGPARFAEGRRPLRVAHLTDLHVGRVTPLSIHEAAVALTNAERPDLVVITGDFVCHSQDYLDALTAIVRGFDAPVLATLGNHDHWSGGPEVRAALERGGAEVLSNVNTVLDLGGERLQVVGLDDAYTSHADRARATRGLDPRLPTLGLSHIAEEADGLWHAGVGLVLAGHTHAGQVTLAGLHELALGRVAGHRYVHGLYGTRRDPAPLGALYVGAGLGAAVMPLRLGERGQREITLFELGAPLGSVDEDHAEQAPLPGRPPSEETKRARRPRGG
jgi:predicted MPP superfamily phosphohydrolase